MQRSVLFLLVLLFHASVSFARQKDRSLEKKLDKVMLAACKPNEPGVAVLIGRQGKIVYEKAFGSAHVELQVPLQPDMVFKIGSVTKQFTAVGILQLVEQGKLSLQDSVQQYVKDFPFKGHTITIEHLLTHTAGLRDYQTIDHPDPFIERHDLTPQFIINHFKNAPLEFTPGAKYWYTNSGYVLLGYIIELVSGQKYHDYMRERVLKPAGLTHTYYAHERNIIPKRVAGYTRDAGYYENTYYQSLSLAYGAGDLLSTVEDLYQWEEALRTYKVINKESLEKAQTPFTLNDGSKSEYGYGWFINTVNGSRCIHHEGQVSGFIAVEQYFPAEDVFVAVLTNVKSGEDKTDFSDKRFELFNNISKLALGKPIHEEIRVSDADMAAFRGEYNIGDKPEQQYTVFSEDGALKMRFPGQRPFAMMPIAKNKFTLRGVHPEVTLTFGKNDSGRVTKMIVYQKGIWHWARVGNDSAAAASNHPLSVFAGKYQLPSMQNAFTHVKLQNNQLTVWSTTGIPELVMMQLSPTGFRAKNEQIDLLFEFVTDKNGKVQKVVITQDKPVTMLKVK